MSAPIKLLLPAGVQPGDVLVSAWLSGPAPTQNLPSDWIELGRTGVGDPNNGGVTTLLLGYHVLSDTENDGTTYTFDGSGGQIATVAYRNAARKQPCTPVTVSSIQTMPSGGMATLDVPPFDTRATSLPLYVFAINGSTDYPTIPNLDRVEATGSLPSRGRLWTPPRKHCWTRRPASTPRRSIGRCRSRSKVASPRRCCR